MQLLKPRFPIQGIKMKLKYVKDRMKQTNDHPLATREQISNIHSKAGSSVSSRSKCS